MMFIRRGLFTSEFKLLSIGWIFNMLDYGEIVVLVSGV